MKSMYEVKCSCIPGQSGLISMHCYSVLYAAFYVFFLSLSPILIDGILAYSYCKITLLSLVSYHPALSLSYLIKIIIICVIFT